MFRNDPVTQKPWFSVPHRGF